MEGDHELMAIQQRCGSAAARLHGGHPVDLAAVADDLERLPDTPVRAALAASLVSGVVRRPATMTQQIRHLDRLLAIADRQPPGWKDWARTRTLARTLTTAQAGADGLPQDPEQLLRDLDVLAGEVGSPAQQQAMRLLRTGPAMLSALGNRDHALLGRVTEELHALHDAFGSDSPYQALIGMQADNAALMAAHESGDREATRAALERLRAGVGRLAPDDPVRAQLERYLAVGAPLLDLLGDDPEPLSDAYLATVRAQAERPDLTETERGFYRSMLGGLELLGSQGTQHEHVEETVARMRRALDEAAPGHPERVRVQLSLALGLVRHAELTGSSTDLDEAERLLDEARTASNGMADPLWPIVVRLLGHVRRLRGERTGSRRADLDVLRRHAWNVLLQSDVRAATVAAREAAAEVTEVARQCLTDNEIADAVRALDAGRGLVLYAAAEMRDVVERLRTVGRADLADRWREATETDPDAVPTPLRRAVVDALSADGTARLLDPPSVGEIRSALRILDTDALVYLVPGDGRQMGWAVMVPARGPTAVMVLPNLTDTGSVDVERYLAASRARDALSDPPASPGPDRDLPAATADGMFAASLDRLCDWMWRAAMGPLIERYAGRELPPVTGRPHRLVLIPMGALARLPWAAARRADGSWAVELVALSQVVSARMLCDIAGRAPVPAMPVGLIVADPDTRGASADLVAARVEAHAIQRSFYPGARYVGRRPDGTPSRSGDGSGAEVRAWLTADDPAAGAMLHLACHGVINTDGGNDTSYLLLAGGDRLTAEELVALMGRRRERAVGLVVLAACRTGVSTRGYDEAYSIGTAFLAGGARSVLSTLWSVPDGATSVLMYMFHHYLTTQRLPACDALRRAQLWMLDPLRQPPTTMPAQLRAQLTDADASRVVAWAGFVHWGQ